MSLKLRSNHPWLKLRRANISLHSKLTILLPSAFVWEFKKKEETLKKTVLNTDTDSYWIVEMVMFTDWVREKDILMNLLQVEVQLASCWTWKTQNWVSLLMGRTVELLRETEDWDQATTAPLFFWWAKMIGSHCSIQEPSNMPNWVMKVFYNESMSKQTRNRNSLSYLKMYRNTLGIEPKKNICIEWFFAAISIILNNSKVYARKWEEIRLLPSQKLLMMIKQVKAGRDRGHHPHKGLLKIR